MDSRVHLDALSAVRSTNFYEHGKRNPSEVIGFFNEYSRAKGAPSPSPINRQSIKEKCRNMAEAITLIHLHESMRHVADDYCHSISRWQKNPSPLSELESLRLFRALYRFQIYCNLLGARQEMEETDLTGSSETETAFHNFLPRFPPWEVQEIACIWKYLEKRWGLLLREVSYVVSSRRVNISGEFRREDWDRDFEYIRSLPVTSEGLY
jgi:hypothetical protein